ncbi:O-antigen ligase [Saccharospirillum sp. MSK14-1]|uniref:O-antigen ligase family protein n=1 Tax=Saccharospirillum sp. MSK14-1 TaxID=1897632 RepID=UPI0011B273A2|nr:O-antigen ligase family protein [Saccharospirillum sp. MSK14-1]
MTTENNNNHIFGSFSVRENWPELCIIFFVVLYPFGEIMHVALLPFLYFLLRHGVERDVWMKPYFSIASLFLIPLLLSSITALVLKRHIEIILQWACYIALGAALIAILRRRINEDLLIYCVAALVLFATLDGLVQFLFGVNFFGNPLIAGRVSGVFYPHLKLSVDLAHLSPFVFEALRRYARSEGIRQFAWLLIVPLALVIFLGGNRSGWLTFFVISVLYTVFLLYRREFPVKVFLIGLMAAIVSVYVSIKVSPGIEERVNRTMLVFSGDSNALNRASSHRMAVFDAAKTVIAEYPWLGVGESGFDEAVVPLGIDPKEVRGDDRRLRHAHFNLLDVPLQTGIVGLIAYLLAFLWLLVRVWQAARHPNAMSFAMAAGVAVAMMPINMHYSFYDVRHASLSLVFLMLSFVYLPAAGAKSKN